MVRVKICGITRPADAALAEKFGADAIGINFVAGTKRCVSVEQALVISQAVGPLIGRVGVFRHQAVAEILQIAASVGLSALQLHDASDDLVAELLSATKLPLIRAVSLRAGEPIVWQQFDSVTPLFDGPDPGSGKAADWAALTVATGVGRPWLLAGGLNPENVAEAVHKLQPWGVDVASGVESSAGVKNADALRLFVQSAKTYPQK